MPSADAGQTVAVAYEFTTPLWVWPGENPWYFVTVPDEESDDMEMRGATARRGFGSLRVRVTVGSTTWSTSVFPSTEKQAYVLPVKKAVRVAEHLQPGRDVHLQVELVDVRDDGPPLRLP